MYINNEDYELLCDIEIYLAKHNKKLFSKIWKLNEKLANQKQARNKKAWENIKAKRELNKNYARPKREWTK